MLLSADYTPAPKKKFIVNHSFLYLVLKDDIILAAGVLTS